MAEPTPENVAAARRWWNEQDYRQSPEESVASLARLLDERVADVKAWALSRIAACRAEETKFGNAWEHREKHSLGPPQALVEAWTERRALQAVLEMLSPGYLARHDARMAAPSSSVKPEGS